MKKPNHWAKMTTQAKKYGCFPKFRYFLAFTIMPIR